MTQFIASQFGVEVTAAQVVSTMSQFNSWEDRYRQVIIWGKQLEPMPEDLKSETVLVSGCESQVWLCVEQVDGVILLSGDSDARIVKGLIAIVFAALNHKSAQEIEQFDIDNYFEQLGLISHLSPSRGNGLKAIVSHIKNLSK
ncbi:cysteine desulfurase sulfur acceptor subunit CsdE [Vibrio sp. WJH972]